MKTVRGCGIFLALLTTYKFVKAREREDVFFYCFPPKTNTTFKAVFTSTTRRFRRNVFTTRTTSITAPTRTTTNWKLLFDLNSRS